MNQNGNKQKEQIKKCTKKRIIYLWFKKNGETLKKE